MQQRIFSGPLFALLDRLAQSDLLIHIVKDKIYKQRESLFDLIFKVVKVEAEQVGEPRVVAHDELHLWRISEHCTLCTL